MITKQELIEVLDMYFTPIFWIAGSVAAVIVISLAIIMVIKPFMRRV